jgi:hypothetical protein
MIRVTNTINSEVRVFENMELVKDHIKSEIEWFNSPNENKNGNGYDSDDFLIDTLQYVICDKTENTGKPYISKDLSNTGEINSAWEFETKEAAEKVISDSNWEWAYVEEN